MSVVNVTDITDNACINIYPIGRDFVAASETDVVFSFDPETLETKDRVSKRFSVNGNYYDYHSAWTLCTHTVADPRGVGEHRAHPPPPSSCQTQFSWAAGWL